ncbi:MAG TPA: NAD-dependent epimerase/dehydratase family protein, partial [Polyangiaceae bacterium]
MKVLVTGATGFLGSWVARELHRAGHTVRILVRHTPPAADFSAEKMEIARGDILSPASLRAAAEGVHAIAHCAGLVSLSLRDRGKLQSVNVDGARNVFEEAMNRGIRVLHTSTIATIGPTPGPTPLDESAPEVPLAFDYPYAETKRRAEALAFDYLARGLDVVILNPGILFGPGDVHYTSTQFVLRYLRRQVWMHLAGGASFGDVRDVAAAYAPALTRGRAGERYILAVMNRTYRDLQE